MLPVMFVLVTSCARYQPMPLSQIPVPERLEAVPDDVIRERAANIQHPILKPLVINEQDGLSPDEAATMAVVANPRLVAIRDQRRLAAAQIITAGILPNPQLSYNVQVPTGVGPGYVPSTGFGLGWNVKRLLRRGANLEAARRQYDSVDLDVGWQEWQAAQSAKLSVYRIVFFQRQLDLAQQAVNGFQNSVDVVQQALDQGYTTIVEMSSARTALLRARALMLSIQQQLTLEKLALNRALGVNPDRDVMLQMDIQPPDLANLPGLADLVQGVEDRRLDLLAFRQGYRSQEARIRSAVRGRFPQINLGMAQATDTSAVNSIGPAVTVGLPFFNRNQGQIAYTRASRQQMFDEYTARLFTARADMAKALRNARTLTSRVTVGEQGIASLTNLVDTYRTAMLQGNADILVFYNARNELMKKQISVMQLRQNLAELSVALELAAGEPLAAMTTGGP